MINEIKKRLDAAPYIYTDKELESAGIDPKLFVFISRPDFSDNSFALWEYIKENTDYKTAWLLLQKKHSAKLTDRGIINAAWDTPEGQALVKSARYFVNTLNFSYSKKTPGQIYINLWHGTGVKATDFLAFSDDNDHLMNTRRIVEDNDLYLVHSTVDKINMAAEFSLDARRFVATGQPRLDRVKTAAGRSNIKGILDGALERYEKLVLYAPTARLSSFSKVGEFFSSNVFNLDGYDHPRLDDVLARHRAALVIKLHPIERDKFKREEMQLGPDCYMLEDDNLFYADLQMNDILNAFDVMISDYSSIVSDFLLLDRPVIYSIGDMDEYSRKEGFVYNDVSFYMPGERADTFDKLVGAIEDAFANPTRHGEWRRTVVKQMCSYMDNNACKRVLDAIENYKPLKNYEEALFTEKVLLPAAREYERRVSEQDEQLRDYENRISLAVGAIRKAPVQNPVTEEVLSLLSTPSVSQSEKKVLTAKKTLESICNSVLEDYSGEYVFLSVPQRWSWTGKTRTMLQQLASKISGMGYLFLLGATSEVQLNSQPIVCENPSARKITETLIALDYCGYAETVLGCIRQCGKKAVFVASSDFFGVDDKILKLGSEMAYKTIYIFRYPVENYLGIMDYNRVDIANWEALNYASHSKDVYVVACNEGMYRYIKEKSPEKEVLLQTPGVDYQYFTKPDALSLIPEKLKRIKESGNPIFGYCGTIDKRLYYSIISYACGARKDYQFVFVGANRITDTWGHVFSDYSNIHLLDEADYGSVPATIGAFDVAFIPYRSIVRERIPSKLFEYFACGKPVVTTEMAVCRKYEHVFSSESHGSYINNLDMALSAKTDVAMQAVSTAIAEENDWNSKAKNILRFIGLKAPSKQ